MDAKGRATTYAYDEEGNLATLTDPEGNETDYSYGALGRVSGLTDALGRSTGIQRDALSRVTEVTHPGGATESFGYDAVGNPTGYTNERGETWRTAYNSIDKVASETDPLGNETTYAYDTEANLTEVTDAKGNETTYVYDALTRLTETTAPNGDGGATTAYSYDAAGRMTALADPEGNTTEYSYDPLDRLTGVTDAEGGEASYAYDAVGRLTGATNPNANTKTYAYDALGRLTEETDPLGNTTAYDHDPVGNLTSRTDARGRKTTYAYDPLDRLTTRAYGDAESGEVEDTEETEEMTYDAVGNLASVTDGTGETTYAYDDRDRLIEEATPRGTIRHAYDAAGNRTALTYPGGEESGEEASYAFDAANRMTSATAPGSAGGAETTYTHDALDRITQTTYPNGAGEAFTYDPLGRVTAARVTGTSFAQPPVLEELTYSYGKNSNVTSITSVTDGSGDGEESAFAYDALDRLTEESYRYRTYSYDYDPVGNRTALEESTPNGTKTTDYAYDEAERMIEAGRVTYAYDENGNLTRKELGQSTTDYAYDYEDRLTKAGDESYNYDAFGRKVSSRSTQSDESGEETSYLYDGPEAIRESTGEETATYLRGSGSRLISRSKGGEGSQGPSYYHHDKLGSVTALSGSEGELTDTYGYTAFGTLTERTGESEQPYTYLANAYDPETKLHDFHARHYDASTGRYDASTGRFTTEDPVDGVASVPQTLNPYIYGINNPYAYPDPDGEIVPLIVAGAAIGSAVGAGSYGLLADDSTWRGAAGAVAGGAVVGGVAPIAVPTATAVGGGTATAVGINAASGVAGSGVSAAIDPDKDFTPKNAVLGAFSAGGPPGVIKAASRYKVLKPFFDDRTMKNFKQVSFPKTWSGVTPKFLGGNAKVNAGRALFNPIPISSSFSLAAELLGDAEFPGDSKDRSMGGHYLTDRANKAD